MNIFKITTDFFLNQILLHTKSIFLTILDEKIIVYGDYVSI